jgi:hypothetical protein
MAVSAVNRISTELAIDDQGYRVYTSVWEVITTAVADGALTALSAAGLPASGSTYVWTDGADAEAIRTPKTSVKMRAEGHRKFWRVTVTHATNPKSCEAALPTSPLTVPIKIKGGWRGRTKIATEDRNGDPLINSSDEPIMPGIEIDDDQDGVTIEVNTATLSLTTRAGFKNRVNSNVMWGCAARTIKMIRWDYELLYHGACLEYFHNVLEFGINTDGWDPRIPDQGFREKLGVDSDGTRMYKTFVSEQDHGPLKQPRMLDGAGSPLPDGDPIEWLEPEVLEETDFSTLGLPNPLW